MHMVFKSRLCIVRVFLITINNNPIFITIVIKFNTLDTRIGETFEDSILFVT